MVPASVRIPVKFEYVFPHGALCLGVEPVRDFEAKGEDKQARENGVRLWQVRVLDLDPEAGKFGGSKEVKVKIAADVQPVPPESPYPGIPAPVEFEDVTVTPYVDSSRQCRERCRGRLAWSVRATAMVPARSLAEVQAAAQAQAA